MTRDGVGAAGEVPALELQPVDITPWRAGNTGLDYVTTLDSGRPGPHLMINALTHGNELCGAHALKFLFEAEVAPLTGRLTLSFANIEAYEAFEPTAPEASRYCDEDFNRLWGADLAKPRRQSRERRRARSMLPVIREIDHLLDLHSMQVDSPPMFVAGALAKSRRLAEALGYPDVIVVDGGHADGIRLRDFGPWGEEDAAQTAALVECGQHWRRESAAVAIRTCLRFLHHFGAITAEFAARYPVPAELPRSRAIEVSELVHVRSGPFRFVRHFAGLEVVPRKGTLIAYDGDQPVWTPHDDCVLVMPSRALTPGLTAVRLGRYVD